MLTPTPIKYVTGDATNPVGPGKRIIAHCCNDAGFWNAGFVRALSQRFRQPERDYRRWARGLTPVPFRLGQVQLYESNLVCASQTSSASRGSDLPQIQSPFGTILSAKASLASACLRSHTMQASTCHESAPAWQAAAGKPSPRSSKTSFAPTA